MINSSYSVIMCNDIQKEMHFFKQIFHFEETFSSDWYISLKEAGGFELAMIDYKHETIPDKYKSIAKGIILNFEVTDVAKLYNEVASILPTSIVMDIKEEDFGQKHFIIQSPSGILVDIIEIIPPSEAFSKQYTEVFHEQE